MAHHRRKNMFDEWDEQLDIVGPIKEIARSLWFNLLTICGYNNRSDHESRGGGEP